MLLLQKETQFNSYEKLYHITRSIISRLTTDRTVLCTSDVCSNSITEECCASRSRSQEQNEVENLCSHNARLRSAIFLVLWNIELRGLPVAGGFRLWQIEWCDRHLCLSRDQKWPRVKCVRLSQLLAFECTLNHCTFIHSFIHFIHLRLEGNLVYNM